MLLCTGSSDVPEQMLTLEQKISVNLACDMYIAYLLPSPGVIVTMILGSMKVAGSHKKMPIRDKSNVWKGLLQATS
jgi:hypothetical protein